MFFHFTNKKAYFVKQGNIWLCVNGHSWSEGSGKVITFDPTNDTIIKSVNGLSFPVSVAYFHDCNNDYYVVAEKVKNRILVYDTNLNFIRSIGENGTGNQALSRVQSVIIGPNNNVWVADFDNNRIVEFTIEGTTKVTKILFYPHVISINFVFNMKLNNVNIARKKLCLNIFEENLAKTLFFTNIS